VYFHHINEEKLRYPVFLLRDFGKVATLLKNKNPNNGI